MEFPWLDDIDATHTIQFPNALYYPNSRFNILVLTTYVRQIGDLIGTHIISYAYGSKFTWAFRKYTRTVLHLRNRLPEISVNNCYKFFTF